MQRVSALVSRDISNYLINKETWDGILINVKAYGAIGDGKTDDTATIQKAINEAAEVGGRVYFPPGTYKVNPIANMHTPTSQPYALLLKSNISFELEGDLTCDPNNSDKYTFLMLHELENVVITGHGTITGDRFTHTGVTGEHGHGIAVRGGENIQIRNLTVKEMWGDCIYVAESANEEVTKDILIENCTVMDARRNNISVIQVDGFKIFNTKMMKKNNVGGTNPNMPGIDFEQNQPGEVIKNVTVDSCFIDGNYNGDSLPSATGIAFGIQPCQNITVTNTRFINCGYGGLRLNKSTVGIVNDCYFENITGFWDIECNYGTNVTISSNKRGGGSRFAGINVLNSDRVNIVGNLGFDDYSSQSILVITCTNVSIEGNICKNSGASALVSSGVITISASSRVKIEGNIVIDANFEGIRVYVSTDVVISGNQVFTSGTYGIRLGGPTSYNITITGNIVKDSNTSGTTDVAHLYVDRSDSVVISANLFKMTAGAANLPTTAVRNNAGVNVTIIGNDAKGSCTGTTFPAGAEYHVINNVIRDGTFA